MVLNAEEHNPSTDDGRRCSLRCLGRPRPNYLMPGPEPEHKARKVTPRAEKQAASVRVPVESGSQASGASLPATEPGISCYAGGPPSDGGEAGKEIGEVSGGGSSARLLGRDIIKSPYMMVKETMRAFNSHYLHFVQEEEQRYRKAEVPHAKFPKALKLEHKRKNGKKVEDDTLHTPVLEAEEFEVAAYSEKGVKRTVKRPDLKAITKMKKNDTILYPEKRIGHLPGIDVGHAFFSRAEMVVVGIHGHWLKGIDYMGSSYAKKEEYSHYKFPLAVCVVLSGMYEDDLDNCDEVIYTGQGGRNLLGNKHQTGDQKLESGNLALKNSMECRIPVRVVRGHGSANSYVGKVYTYDGLYQVQQYWAEKGVSGFTVFKYRLKRIEGQPPLTTNQVIFTGSPAPTSSSTIRGLIEKDISEGTENFAIPVTNMVDDPPFAPKDYKYCISLQVAENIEYPENAVGCNCKGECIDPRICACARLNGGHFPYVHQNGGRLIEAKAVLFECGPNCGCKPSCVNRTSQQGLKYHLEVFRTPKKGWGVRSWDKIPAGAPICEYTGTLTKTDEVESDFENGYIFDIDCLQTMKGLDGRKARRGDVSMHANFDDKKAEVPEFCIDAGPVGNVARFINHSCCPNLFVQSVLSSHHDIRMARVVLFAADTIPPMQELTYDYGYALDSVVGPDGSPRKLECYCGAADCRKRLY